MGSRISHMYKKAGGTDYKHSCRDCSYLVSFMRGKKRFYKCLRYGDGGVDDYSSDWNKDWTACKLYSCRDDISDEQIEGQMSIFDL